MGFDEYQKEAARCDLFEATRDLNQPGFVAKVFGICEEAGEVSGKFKKIIRDKEGKISDEDREEIVKELGDVLWYVASIARYMGVNLSYVADKNMEKLLGRLERGTLHGKGDNR